MPKRKSPDSQDQATSRYSIRAVERTLRLLSILSDGKRRTLTELSEAIGLSSSTTFRILATLERNRYVERDASGYYQLGLACLELAQTYHMGSDIRQAALPELEKLRDETRETVHLAVLDKMEVVYIEKLSGLCAVQVMSSRVGGRLPAYCTGLGKVLLAYSDPQLVRAHFEQTGLFPYTTATIRNVDDLMRHLEEVRRQGYALDRGEHEAEVRCVAAPIFDGTGEVVAAISVAGPAGRMEPLAERMDLIERTLRAARTISSRLGHRELRPEQETYSRISRDGHEEKTFEGR
ncbi:MAG: IclR family transcriptional regulator [Anaerolineae bacterium]|nr:IclR family transcriptional regulator [Anaerolineae bacterium]MDW8071403.1 IclR family transcriptional regulator [Anaerolineae bacterium]